MQRGVLQSVAAWLCTVVVAFTGAIPGARTLVLCFEPDGSIALEGAVSGGGCDGCTESGSEEPALVRLDADPGCACLDIPISAPGGERSVPSTARELCVAVPCLALRVAAIRAIDAPCVAVRDVVPRPMPGRALLRTVVLRV